jgi:hypothetical protein
MPDYVDDIAAMSTEKVKPNGLMTPDQVLVLLRQACNAAGSQSAWAQQHGVSDAYVSAVLAGKKLPGPRILRGIGLRKERVVLYSRQ